MKYLEMKKKHEEEFYNFPHFFAFNEDQFEKGKAKLGVTDSKDIVIWKDFGNPIMRKVDAPRFSQMLLRHLAEKKELFEDDQELVAALKYELNNHEYSYTRDPSDTIAVFDGSVDISTKRFAVLLSRAMDLCCLEEE